jgi:gluconolactonase
MHKNIKVVALSALVLSALLVSCRLPGGLGKQPAPPPEGAAIPTRPAPTKQAAAPVKVSQPTQAQAAQVSPVTNTVLSEVAGKFQFAEGPAADSQGNVYFSDINAGRIYKWSANGQLSTFREGLNAPNGTMFDSKGNLVVCEGGSGRLVSIDPAGNVTPVVENYLGKRFNEPNDLWIDQQGGIYFTDPVFQGQRVQDGEYVYYVSPDRSTVTPVIKDLVKPNGIIGSRDGKTLYVADYGAGLTYRYSVNSDGSLSGKKMVIQSGSDGMELDTAGNLYLTTPNKVQVFDNSGKHLVDIQTQENPTNLAFGGADGKTVLITARTKVYTLASNIGSQSGNAPTGTGAAAANTFQAGASGFTLTSPEVTEGGMLPVEYTCDGESSTLALAWQGAPAATKSYAMIMHHVAAPDDIHWYWVLWNIPAEVTSLPKNMTGIGTLGTNSVNDKTAYSPPCSKGPGNKQYTYTVYALSGEPKLTVPATQVNRAALLDAIKDITLASAELNVIYSRK